MAPHHSATQVQRNHSAARSRLTGSGSPAPSSLDGTARARASGSRQRAPLAAARGVGSLASPAAALWCGLPCVETIATSTVALGVTLALPHSPRAYCMEADALRSARPDIVWHRDGKPDKLCLGSRSRPEDWDKFRGHAPRILEAAEVLLRSFPGQSGVEVLFGDVLDYNCALEAAQPQLLGWHQDNMDITRHTFTVVLTLAAEGDGRNEWREIAPGSVALGGIVASMQPGAGDLGVHGLACNNALAHRAFWDTGRRVALVMFCRSAEMEAQLRTRSLESQITMRHWWSKAFETTK